MGMFDSVICLMPLPKTVEGFEFSKDTIFQTKDLENLLSLFTFKANGEVWEDARAWTNKPKIKRVYKLPATIEFYADHPLTRAFYTYIAYTKNKLIYKIKLHKISPHYSTSTSMGSDYLIRSDSLVPVSKVEKYNLFRKDLKSLMELDIDTFIDNQVKGTFF